MENSNLTKQTTQPISENTNKPSKFDLVSRWFILIYLTLSFFGPFLIISPFAIVTLFMVLGNKPWRYSATAITSIVSGLFSLALGALSGFGYNPNNPGNEMYINFVGIIYPLLSLAVLIVCIRFSIKLNREHKKIN